MRREGLTLYSVYANISKDKYTNSRETNNMREKLPKQAAHESERSEAEMFNEAISQIDALATNSIESYTGVDGNPVRGGRFHGAPELDMNRTPFGTESTVSASVLDPESENPIRIVKTAYYATTDRGSFGYELHRDGRVVEFFNSELNGLTTKDEPDKYEENLREATRMLNEYKQDMANANARGGEKTHKRRGVLRWLGRFSQKHV